MCGCNTACCLNRVPDHDSCHPYFITWETYILREFMIHIFPAMELTLFHRRFSKCRPPPCNQALNLLKIFHDTHFIPCFFFRVDYYFSALRSNVGYPHKSFSRPPQIIIGTIPLWSSIRQQSMCYLSFLRKTRDL